MSYHIGFWIGPRPVDEETACADINQRIIAARWTWQTTGTAIPPLPRLGRFVDAVLTHLPEDPADPHCPWPYAGIDTLATADTFIVPLDGPRSEALAVLARLADEHDLRAFDLARHRILREQDVTSDFGIPLLSVTADGTRGDDIDCRGWAIAGERLGLSVPVFDEPDEDEDWDEFWDAVEEGEYDDRFEPDLDVSA